MKEADAPDSCLLLSHGHFHTPGEQDEGCQKPRPFSILDISTLLSTGFRFPIVGTRGHNLEPRISIHALILSQPKILPCRLTFHS
jgi:hypothetical protein